MRLSNVIIGGIISAYLLSACPSDDDDKAAASGGHDASGGAGESASKGEAGAAGKPAGNAGATEASAGAAAGGGDRAAGAGGAGGAAGKAGEAAGGPAAGSGGASSGAGSVAFACELGSNADQTMHSCTDYSYNPSLPDDLLTRAKDGCTKSNGSVKAKCDHTGSVGGCTMTKASAAITTTTTIWHYTGDAESEKKTCAQLGSSYMYIAP